MPASPRAAWILALLAIAPLGAQDHLRHIADCRVTWDSPSARAVDAMPLPGSKGALAWVRFSEGALRIRPAHGGAITEDETYGSLGNVRIAPEGIDLSRPRSFRQTLVPDEGAMTIEVVAADGAKVSWRLWFGAESLVIETRLSRPAPLVAAFGHATVNPALRGDDRVDVVDGALLYAHRNAGARRTRQLAGEQGQDAAKLAPVVATRAYGLAIAGDRRPAWRPPVPATVEGVPGHEWTGVLPASAGHVLTLTLGASSGLMPEDLARRGNNVANGEVLPSVRLAAEQRWEDFWRRGGIAINAKAGPSDAAHQVGRNHTLARFLMAANQGAELPPPLRGGLSDPRGGRPVGWTGQGLRMVGWAAVAGGDDDLLTPVLRLYRDRHGTAKARAALAKVPGALYPEAITLAGLSALPTGPDGMPRDPVLSRHLTSPVEFAWMAARARLDLGRDLRADLPWMLDAVRAIDGLYTPKPAPVKPTKGAKPPTTPPAPGPLVLHPGSALGVCPGATNPADLVAGLRALTSHLASSDQVGQGDKDAMAGLGARLPELPTGRRGETEFLLPAAKAPRIVGATELPELHAAWPFGLVGVAAPTGLELAQATWELAKEPRGEPRKAVSLRRGDVSGQPTLAILASLGLAEEGGKAAVAKMADAASSARFPLIHGAAEEGPDLASLGAGMTGLHAMLVASEPDPKGRLFLLPAWPRNWDVTFRVRAPGGTIVDGTVESGKLVRLVTTPVERRDDVVLPEGWSLPPR